jgi:serine/threonine protein kinase
MFRHHERIYSSHRECKPLRSCNSFNQKYVATAATVTPYRFAHDTNSHLLLLLLSHSMYIYRFVTNPRARRFMLGLPESPPIHLGQKFPEAKEQAIDLLSRMLTLDPAKRISVADTLEHPYLASLHDVTLEPKADSHVNWRDIEEVS